jgi:hypothetical protein
MNNLFLLTACCFLFLTSCKKGSTTRLYPEHASNELKAMISVASSTSSLHKANGDHTTFSSHTQNGDTIITVIGSIGKYGTISGRSVEIRLRNISAPGTYQFKVDNGLRQKTWCMYIVGGYYNGTVLEIYGSDNGTPPGV